jgi:hypothetical protein
MTIKPSEGFSTTEHGLSGISMWIAPRYSKHRQYSKNACERQRPNFFTMSGGTPDTSSSNSKAVPGYARVPFLSCPKNLVDSTNKLRSSECDQVVVRITVCHNGVIDVELILDEMFVDRVNRVQWGFLTRDPDVITTRFLCFRPG